MPKRIEAWEDGQGGIHRTEWEAILAHANYELRNFLESDLPIGRRSRLTARNLWRRLVLRQSCCGNDGQPGC